MKFFVAVLLHVGLLNTALGQCLTLSEVRSLLEKNRTQEGQFMRGKGFILLKGAQERGLMWRAAESNQVTIERDQRGQVGRVNCLLPAPCFPTLERQALALGLQEELRYSEQQSHIVFYSAPNFGVRLEYLTVAQERIYYLFVLRKREYQEEKLRAQRMH